MSCHGNMFPYAVASDMHTRKIIKSLILTAIFMPEYYAKFGTLATLIMSCMYLYICMPGICVCECICKIVYALTVN